MKRNSYKGNLMLLLTALIWGTAFVAQSSGAGIVGPFTYNCFRNLIACAVLIPIVRAFDEVRKRDALFEGGNQAEEYPGLEHQRRIRSWKAGLVCGVFLFIASNFQQYGLGLTTAGKAGFITALYIVIVPVLGIFLHKKTTPILWVSVAIAVVGFYFLCMKDGLSISRGDLMVLCCSVFFSLHILVIDHFNDEDVDGVRMSQAQFLMVAALSLPFMFLADHVSFADVWNAKWQILYTAVFSSGVAYTLQILGQRYTEPAVATLLMSLESVFAALSGWFFLHEQLSMRELLGCALVFAAVLLAQMSGPKTKTDPKTQKAK